MAYESDLGDIPIINDDSAYLYVDQIRDPSTPFTGGYEARPYERAPLGAYATPMNRPLIPRAEWESHIKRQERDKTSPDDWRRMGDVPILDQNGLPYCWCYGMVGAIMTVYAMSGTPVPHLSATGPAAQGKNWRKDGGWAGEAIEYIRKYGIPTLDAWPEHSMDRSLPGKHEVQLSAKQHGIVEFEELPRNSFESLMTVLLDPVDPRPVTLGLNWWGHLVYAVRAVALGSGKFGALIANSWKLSWGKQGCSVLSESKATAFEQIAPLRIQQRAA